MAIRILFKDGSPVAECDTVDEAVEIIYSGSPMTPRGPCGLPNLFILIHEQKPRLHLLLRSLHESHGEIKAADLARNSGIDEHSFGGLFGALSKHAANAGIDLEDIYTTEVRFSGSMRERWYARGRRLGEMF